MRLTQYPDVESIIQTETLMLRPDMPIDIVSVPADFDDLLEAELPTPVAPRLGVEKDEKGRVLLDDNNQPIIRYNLQDPDYREKKRIVGKLQAVMTIVAGVAPGQFEFEASKQDLGPRAYYVAVLKEMKAFGLSMGDLLKLVLAIGRLSGLSEKDIKAAELGFSMPGDTSDSSS